MAMKTLHVLAGMMGMAAATAVATTVAAEALPRVRVEVEHPGVYQVSWQDVVDAGLPQHPAIPAAIAVSTRGRVVPAWVEGGGDGSFDRGDRVLFVGESPRGQVSLLDEYSPVNVYWLEFGSTDGVVGRTVPANEVAADVGSARPVIDEHVERDLLLARFNVLGRSDEDERWYWARISVMDRDPFQQVLDVYDLDRAGPGGQLTIRVGLRGWSQPHIPAVDKMAHHLVEVRLDDRLVGSGEWKGVERKVIEIVLPAAEVTAGSHRLSVKVPRRKLASSGDLLPDIVLLSWIELEYPTVALVKRPQTRLRLVGTGGVELRTDDGAEFAVYSTSGARFPSRRGRVVVPAAEGGDEHVIAVRAGAELHPASIRSAPPTGLRAASHRADMIMITQHTLRAEATRLAEFHRRHGLAVEIVDIADIFDEFNFGLTHPRAIRDFIALAHSTWTPPAPRFVLLVGDASWDLKNPTADDSHYADWTYRPWETTNFVKNSSTAYAGAGNANDRGLIPTHNYPTYQGYAASDTWFACVEGDDDRPDVAIGRLPAATPDELAGMIDKVITYVDGAKVGPWRRGMLFIANENPGFQQRMDTTAQEVVARGFVPIRVYPRGDQPVNAEHTERIVRAFDDGLLLVEFLGHGGRYIWRTAPSDLKENRDLFTLEHLDRLTPPPLLPVVVSLTCYSAPFDHPTADSIGEKLVRIPGRGAIAVVAASWRNSPSTEMGRVLMEELLAPGATIGEAVMRMKQQIANPMLIQLYNLLGDPAVPMATPDGTIELALGRRDETVLVQGRIGLDGFEGAVIVDWLGPDGESLGERRFEISDGSFEVPISAADWHDAVGVRAYAWNESADRDAIGWADGSAIAAHGADVTSGP